jgi:hypothetical protein
MLKTLLGTNDPYQNAELTEAVNTRPTLWGWLRNSGWFKVRRIATTVVGIGKKEGTIVLIPSKERGEDPTYAEHDKRNLRFIQLAHFPFSDRIMPEDLQNISALDMEDRLEMLDSVFAERFMRIGDSHDVTKEYGMAGAVQGKMLDADGTVLADYYNELGFTKKSVSMALGTSTTKIRSKTNEITAYIEKNLKGEVMTGRVGILGEEMWDALTNHDDVRDIFKQSADARGVLADDLANTGFAFGGIVWYRYLAQASNIAGDTRLFMPTDKGVVIPAGTRNMFELVVGPANRMSDANKLGRDIWIQRHDDPKDRFTELDSEANYICLNKRPDLVVHLT